MVNGIQGLKDFVPIVTRRKWFVIGCILGGLILAGVAAGVVPLRFRSTTTLAVENQKIPENYVKDVLTGNVQDRLGTIQQILLSRSLLTEVIEKHRLYGSESEDRNVETAVSRMRKAITVSPAKDQVFSIAFTYHNPIIAQQVAETLGDLFIQENSKIREQMVEGASEFLSTELDKARIELEKKEQAIGHFKRLNMGELPQQLDANLRSLDRLQLQAVALNDTLDNRLQRLTNLDKVINEYEPHEAGVSPSTETSALNGSTDETTSAYRKRVRSNDPRARISELQQNLARLRAVYKESYPDVVALKEEIARLVAQVRSDNEDFSQEAEPTKSAEHGEKKPAKKPVVDMYLKEMLRQRNDIRSEIETLRERLGKITQQSKAYEKRVEQVPQLEIEIQNLTRDYDNMQRNYQSLLDKRLNAKISQNLELHQKFEHFRIIDKANLPLSPEPPTPLHFILLGLLMGCGIGVGGAVILEQSSGVFRKSEDVEGLMEYPVLATIGNIKLADQNRDLQAREGISVSGQPNGKNSGVLALTGRLSQEETDDKRSMPREKRTPPDAKAAPKGAGQINITHELNMVTKWRPTSIVSEQFRVGATRLVLSMKGKGSVVVVTSAVNGEGKTTTASNLAYVLAHDLGKRTVLIDCDFKRPMVHNFMGVPSKPGLVEAIYGDFPIETCMHSMGEAQPVVIPCGRRNHRVIDLTKIPQVQSIINNLREKFDFIIVDAPPILPLADMNLLGEMADMMVLVIRLGQTSQVVAQAAVKALKPSGSMSIILTDAEIAKVPYLVHAYYSDVSGTYSK